MNKAKIKCNSCGLVFQNSTELERNIKECPQCIEKRQDEMMRIMFGQTDFPAREVKKDKQSPTSRDNAILAMRMKGKTLEEIGLSFDLTRERVRQIISKFGPEIDFPNITELRHKKKKTDYGVLHLRFQQIGIHFVSTILQNSRRNIT